ncbi:Imm63 family immunity protein [Xanthomonas sp. GPE 39]|uniref:Imm63 family immunity protein n=1 Tax=Xanthomonas sp. GPE 39 TaxID=1583099 RepID=UPI0009E3C715|nr:Imm63 family immunity protein [Xanthomonas sp. GPE 39]
MNEEILKIQNELFSLGRRIDAPEKLLVIRKLPSSDANPFLIFENGKFVYECVERNYQVFRKETSSSDDVLYWIFDGIISDMIADSEDFNKIEDVDIGRMDFILRRINLMERLSPVWGKKAREESDEELRMLDSVIAAKKTKSDTASVMEKLHAWLVAKGLLPRR